MNECYADRLIDAAYMLALSMFNTPSPTIISSSSSREDKNRIEQSREVLQRVAVLTHSLVLSLLSDEGGEGIQRTSATANSVPLWVGHTKALCKLQFLQLGAQEVNIQLIKVCSGQSGRCYHHIRE